MPTPMSLTVRTYQVGFGDCFVLIFGYDDGSARHMLVDMGTTALPRTPSRRSMLDIAKDITREADDALQVVIATHRHADHISGFAGRSGEEIAAAAPKLVVQSWTEDPDIPTDATAPLGFVSALDSMQLFAQYTQDVSRAKRAMTGLPKSMVEQLGFLGETNISNAASVRNLVDMAQAARGFYAKYGDVLPVGDLLPGVTIRVLGPPTVEQWSEIKHQRHVDEDEFWVDQERYWSLESGLADASAGRLFDAKTRRHFNWPFAARWAIERVKELRADQLLRIVRTLDDALNNTSVILLIEVGGMRLLFPGDAQIEEWLWPLREAPDAAANRDELAQVDFYKVGHHGSRNATPRSLWQLWGDSGRLDTDPAMRTVVSTRGNVHGRWWRRTEVPRRTLVDALKQHTEYHTTQTQRAGNAYRHDIQFDLRGGR